jgi:hypothetical protein
MIIHFYLSEQRIKDLLFQINPNLLTETTNKIDKELALKGEIKGGVPKWIEFLGFGGEASFGTEGKIAFSKEIKPISTNFYILEVLKNVIITNEFNSIDDNTFFKDLNEKEVIRVKGKFRICVEGSTGMERINNFDRLPYIEWEGVFNDIKIKFGTSKDNYLARTAIYQCLSFPEVSADIDFFGVLTKIHSQVENQITLNCLDVLPLFFGVEIDI